MKRERYISDCIDWWRPTLLIHVDNLFWHTTNISMKDSYLQFTKVGHRSGPRKRRYLFSPPSPSSLPYFPIFLSSMENTLSPGYSWTITTHIQISLPALNSLHNTFFASVELREVCCTLVKSNTSQFTFFNRRILSWSNVDMSREVRTDSRRQRDPYVSGNG